MPVPATLAGLRTARYIQLTTFRRDGRAVPTPVWFAFDDDALVVFSNDAAGKVRRLRHTDRVVVAPCDIRGRVLGPAVEGTATLTDPAGTRRVLDAIRRRYGWQARLLDWGTRLRGRSPEERRAGIVVRLA